MDIVSALGDLINMVHNKIESVAVKTGFKIRKSPLKPITFVMALSIYLQGIHQITLKTLCGKCEEIQAGLKISKQALHQRMEVGEILMNELFKLIFSEIANKNTRIEHIEVLQQFTDIKITDGTTISLPDKLENIYKGLGGKNANAAIKIQTTYSLSTRSITNMDIFAATKHDATYNATTLTNINPGELWIKDLGYFDGDYFEAIEEAGAFYISRIKTNCVLYTKNDVTGNFEEFEITKLLQKTKSSVEKELYIKRSKGQLLNVRLVGTKLPENVSNEKKRKANKNAASAGKVLTEKEKVLLEWFINITNIPDDMLDIKTIGELYRLRWQSELHFKALKSSLDLNDFSMAGEHYFKCLLYGKLIMVLLTTKVFAWCSFVQFKKSTRLISIQSFMKNFRNRCNVLFDALLKPTKWNWKRLDEILTRIVEISLFEKRKRKNTETELMEHDLPENILKMLVGGY